MSDPAAARKPWSPEFAYEVLVGCIVTVAVAAMAYLLYMGNSRDLYVVLTGSGEAPASQVALVEIDAATLKLWDPADPEPEVTSRRLLAEVVEALTDAGASVVALDFLLEHPHPGDPELMAAIERNGRVVIAERRLVGHTRPVILATHSGLGDGFLPGLANLNDEEAFLFSDKLRVDTAPLSGAGIRPRTRIAVPNILPTGPDQMPADPMAAAYKIPEVIGAAGDLQLLPSFPLAAAWLQQDPQLMAADWPTSFCTPLLDKPCPETVGDLGLPGESQALADNIGIVWRPRTGPQGRAFDHVSASLLVADRVMPGMTDDTWKKKVRGKVAIVGRTDVASKDFFVTGHSFPLYAHADCPGMSIQAEIVDNLLRGQRVRYAPDWIVAVLSLFIAGLIIGIGRRLHGGVHVLASLGVVVAFIGLGCAVYAVTEGTVIEPRLPLLAGWIGLLGTHWKRWLES